MDNKDPKTGSVNEAEADNDVFNRDDSKRRDNRITTPFAKDRRARSRVVEKVSSAGKEGYRKDNETYRKNSENGRDASGERKSYNPNFTRENKFKGSPDSRRDFNREGNRDYGRRYDRDETGGNQRSGNRDADRDYNRDGYRSGYSRPGRDGDRQQGGYSRDSRSSGQREYQKGRPAGNKFNKNNKYKSKGGDGNQYRNNRDGSYPAFPAPMFSEDIRLNRYIATSGLCSRREADDIIAAGRVKVNGTVVTEMGAKVSPQDVVTIDDKMVRSEKKIYIVMNKPKGYVTTVDDPHAEKTVMDLLKDACRERVYPVGRLDKNSVGVLLFTNDGDITKKLTHPSYNKKKIYQVSIDKPLTKADMEQIISRIQLEDGEIHADQISYVDGLKKEIGIEIHSGHNRIVRRIFEHLGYKVLKLDRVYFAGLTKKNLKRGAWRFLSPREVQALKSGLYE